MLISHHYLALVINSFQLFLQTTPEVKRFKRNVHNGAHSIYYFTDPDTHKRHEHADFTPKGQKLAQLYDLRCNAKDKLHKYTLMWRTQCNCPIPKLDIPKLRRAKARSTFVTKEFYDSLVPQSNPKEVEKPNPYNGIIFRSKSEREIAECLDELGIEYKYEPLMRINNTDVYPDFVCFIPELGIGFIIEHFGIMDSPRYLERANRAIQGYLNLGLIPGIDILFTYEKSTVPPRKNYIGNALNFMLDNLCAP